MAVAPAFSVSELYHLLIEEKGYSKKTKKNKSLESPLKQSKPHLVTS